MKQMPSAINCRQRQRGVSVITAIFLLLLMAMLAAAMVSIVSTSHMNMAADIGGTRAYQAARSGAEWGMYQLDPNAQSAALPTCVDGTPPIPDHTVTVKCLSYDYTEANRQLRIFRISAKAVPVSAKAPGIERWVEVTIEKCRDATVTSPPYGC